jgi:hypothetical protein
MTGRCYPGLRLVFSALAACLTTLPASAGENGTITGSLDQPNLVTSIHAIDRKTDKKYAGKLDARTGRFAISGLPVGQRYDCLIDFAGARLEGVSLKVPPSDFEEEQPLTAEDIDTINTKVRGLNKFEDVVDILTVTGNVQHAAVLINKLRTKPFYESKPGEVIWRAELWHFERPEETWVKVQDELFLVLYRERLQKATYDKKSVTFEGALGGLQPTRQQPNVELGTIKLPSKEPGIRLRSQRPNGTKVGR